MKRIHMLLGLLIVLAGGAGYLYQDGYWDTWADKKDALAAELLQELGEVPEEARQPFADCLAKMGTELAEQLECPLADEPSLVEQVGQCAVDNGAQQVLGFGTLQCIMEVQAQLGAQEQQAP